MDVTYIFICLDSKNFSSFFFARLYPGALEQLFCCHCEVGPGTGPDNESKSVPLELTHALD